MKIMYRENLCLFSFAKRRIESEYIRRVDLRLLNLLIDRLLTVAVTTSYHSIYWGKALCWVKMHSWMLLGGSITPSSGRFCTHDSTFKFHN